jgi:hypothetical protein
MDSARRNFFREPLYFGFSSEIALERGILKEAFEKRHYQNILKKRFKKTI